MEITCNRCHQPLEADSCFCPTCGLPQLVYSSEGGSGQAQPERGNEARRDASSVDWKPALRAGMILAVPAGVLSGGIAPLGILGLFWMSAAAAWAVTLYVRNQRPAWVTIGAGARIGLATGLMAAALGFAVGGAGLFIQRFFLHQGNLIESGWRSYVEEAIQLQQKFASMTGALDQPQFPAQLQAEKNLMLSPEGHAAYQAFGMATNSVFLLLFAAAGGALGARLLARSRRPEV